MGVLDKREAQGFSHIILYRAMSDDGRVVKVLKRFLPFAASQCIHLMLAPMLEGHIDA